MIDQPKLGRLVVKEQRQALRAKSAARRASLAPKPAPGKRRSSVAWIIAGWVCLVALAVGIGILWANGWLPAQFHPRKLIVRGCVLTKPEDVLVKLDCTSQVTYPQLLGQAHSLDTSSERWLRGVEAQARLPRTAVLTVQERQPVLRAIVGGVKYWLCSDGSLARMDVKADHGGAYDRIRRLPSIELPATPDSDEQDSAGTILAAAACCEQVMPGVIDRIVLGPDGMLDLYDRQGFRIYLGQASEVAAKIAALPKALRICAADRERLKYLDASNPRIFYEVWKEPLASVSPAGNTATNT
jgi:cell division septal protein FtsQ